MKKLFLSIIALTLCTGLWADQYLEEARQRAINGIQGELTKHKAKIDQASTYEAAKTLQESAKAEMQACANTAIA